jgi:hypothetical protein
MSRDELGEVAAALHEDLLKAPAKAKRNAYRAWRKAYKAYIESAMIGIGPEDRRRIKAVLRGTM